MSTISIGACINVKMGALPMILPLEQNETKHISKGKQ